MENPQPSETLGTEDPAGRIQEEASGLMVISEQCTRLTSARVVSVEENGKTSAANDNGVRVGNGEVETEMIQLEEVDDCIRGDGLTKFHTGNNCVIGADIEKGYTDNCGVDVLNEVQIDHNVSRLSNKTDAFSFVESQSDTNLLDLSGIGSGAAGDKMFLADRTIETELNVDGTEASMVDFEKNLEVTTDGTLSSADTECYPSRFMQINLDVENRSDLHAIKGNSEQARAEGLEKVSDNQNNRFSVGDIVWAKTKNQKWWPGKIYNPVDAPEHVTKSGPDNFPLVGYFGMTHFAWCCPSQLKAFYDNFEQISATNKARIFLGAVEKAVNEFGRNLQLDMTCSCALRGNQLIAGQLSSIGGVKPVMKASELGEFSFVHFKSAKFLAHIKDLAHVVSMPQLLDFTVTRNRLTAFHRFIGHSQLSMHLLLEKDDMVWVGNRSKRRAKESLKSTLLSNKPVEVSPKTMKSRASRLGNVGGVKQGNMENEFESRERKKSRYLCYPFIDMEKTGLPAATEDSKVLKDARDGLDANSGASQCKASISNSKCSAEKFWKKWYRTFIRGSGISSNSELLNASSTQLLFELSSAAVDCLYPIENEKFDSVGWFFSRYRISVYQDESISEIYMVGKNEVAGAEALSKGEHTSSSPTVVGKNVIGLQDVKGTLDTRFDNNSLTRKKKGRAKIARPKTKSLSGLSDVNINITSSSSSIKDTLETVPLFACSKGKQKEGDACAQYLNTNQTIGIPDLNRSSVGPSILVDDSLISGHVAFEGKSDLPRDVGKQAISRHSNANNSNGLLDVNINYAKPGSLVVDLSVPRTGLLLDFVGNCVHPGLTWQDPKITDLLSAEHKPKQRKRKKKEKAVPEHQTAGIPDLNETGAVEKEFGETTGLSPPVKSKPKKKRRRQVVPNYPTNVSFGGRLDININYDSVETNGKAIGSALVLNFSQGVPVPSKEYLSSLFSKFGPLNQLDTQLNDPRSARIVFMKGVDAGEAFRSLAQNNPFGANLTNYGLRHLPTDVLEPCPNLCATSVLSVGGEVANCIQRPNPNPCPNEAPSIEAMRKNLQVMKSMLEQSGDNLPPEVRTKLEGEIKGLLKKVSSMADVSS